mmetsp:Transcript_119524/g.333469  ORF Transcript_119524/g.333469 Transcript_119524/m.333469 type:complete len:231 (-) Transcript_119524:103-795(-)
MGRTGSQECRRPEVGGEGAAAREVGRQPQACAARAHWRQGLAHVRAEQRRRLWRQLLRLRLLPLRRTACRGAPRGHLNAMVGVSRALTLLRGCQHEGLRQVPAPWHQGGRAHRLRWLQHLRPLGGPRGTMHHSAGRARCRDGGRPCTCDGRRGAHRAKQPRRQGSLRGRGRSLRLLPVRAPPDRDGCAPTVVLAVRIPGRRVGRPAWREAAGGYPQGRPDDPDRAPNRRR